MKIERFKGISVNGYLDFDISFFEDITFVTGINGTGKTTALNSIAALLLPRLDYLSSEQFEKLSLDILHDGKAVTLSVHKDEFKTEIQCSLFPEQKVSFAHFEIPDSIPTHRIEEYEAEHHKEMVSRFQDNPIIEYIEELPAPMYLGLDRRSLSVDIERMRYRRTPLHSKTKKRNIFARSLGASLNEALFHAQENFRKDRTKQLQLDAKFRQDLVVTLIDFSPISISTDLDNPSDKDLKKIDTAKKNLKRLPRLLNVPIENISKNIDPLFEFLEQKLKIINRPIEKNESEQDREIERISALIEWSYNRKHLEKIDELSKMVSNYNKEIEKIFKRTNEFLDTINSFLQDSGKKLTFGSIGELTFFLKNEEEERDIRTLSSGEIQLIVILTHLYFNPEVSQANVFIIDEPELSLHVQWQEKFVDSISSASNNIQFILATHSPSIILDKTSNCSEIAVK